MALELVNLIICWWVARFDPGRAHSTSKITQLEHIATSDAFGFRGQAIHALCALSKLSIWTCAAQPIGHVLEFAPHGALLSTTPASRTRGNFRLTKEHVYPSLICFTNYPYGSTSLDGASRQNMLRLSSLSKRTSSDTAKSDLS